MSNQSGTSLNIGDGFGASAHWSRRAVTSQAAPGRQAGMARDGYTPLRQQDPRVAPPAYATLRSSCTRAR